MRPTRVEPPQNCYTAQIPGHTNYALSVMQPFPSNTGLRFFREMAVATIRPFRMLRSLCLTLSLLMSYLYGAACKVRNVNVVYIYGPTFGNAESRLFLFAA
jgi:hypothetical protein